MKSKQSSRAIGAALACLVISLSLATGTRAQTVTFRYHFMGMQAGATSLTQGSDGNF
jgi:hypothetical protein